MLEFCDTISCFSVCVSVVSLGKSNEDQQNNAFTCVSLVTLSVAGQSFASSDPDGGAGRGRNPGNSL